MQDVPYELKQREQYIPERGGANIPPPLGLLSGIWRNVPEAGEPQADLTGRGWNMIALPFGGGGAGNPFKFRLLLNQYNETLDFFLVDRGVPNRGLPPTRSSELDQFILAMDYVQEIQQIAVDDFPASELRGNVPQAIHHEPGLWLNMLDQRTDGMDVARLATIPHGNSVLAPGVSRVFDGPPTIPDVSGLPIGLPADANIDSRYLGAYKHFTDAGAGKFLGLFDPTKPAELLKEANAGVTVVKTTELHVDTKFGTGGISNIPFIEKQADATEMESIFWIEELAEKDDEGRPRMRLQYLQTVMLDFFPRGDGVPGLIKWPHVSINTLEWRRNSKG